MDDINSFTLNNNLTFNNQTQKNNLLLQKKHRMDISLQKALDLNSTHKNTFININSNLNLLNNCVKLKIKKPKN